mgnify:CR=1 FL=1
MTCRHLRQAPAARKAHCSPARHRAGPSLPAGNTAPSVTPLDFKSNLMVLPQVSIFAKRIGTPSTGSLFISGFSAIIP